MRRYSEGDDDAGRKPTIGFGSGESTTQPLGFREPLRLRTMLRQSPFQRCPTVPRFADATPGPDWGRAPPVRAIHRHEREALSEDVPYPNLSPSGESRLVSFEPRQFKISSLLCGRY